MKNSQLTQTNSKRLVHVEVTNCSECPYHHQSSEFDRVFYDCSLSGTDVTNNVYDLTFADDCELEEIKKY